MGVIAAYPAASAMIASTAVSVGTAIYSGYQANQQAKYQAEIDENNAKMAQYQADNAKRLGEVEKDDIRLRLAQLQGEGEVGYAAGNVQLGSGSPLSWEMDIAEQAAQDLELSEYNTQVKAQDFLNQSSNYSAQADLTRSAGRNAFTTTALQAAGTVARGSADYYKYRSGYFKYQT